MGSMGRSPSSAGATRLSTNGRPLDANRRCSECDCCSGRDNMTAPIIIDVTDGVLSITWNYPERLNALSTEMLSAAAAAIEAAPDNVRVILLCGAGRAFSSGGDGRELNAETIESGPRLVRAITRARQPVIGGVNGPAVGIGCS